MTTLSAFALRAAKGAGVPVRVCHAHSTFDRHSDHYLIKAARCGPLPPRTRPCAWRAESSPRKTCSGGGRRRRSSCPTPSIWSALRPTRRPRRGLGLEGRLPALCGAVRPAEKPTLFAGRLRARATAAADDAAAAGGGRRGKGAARARRAARPCRARPLPAAGRSRAVGTPRRTPSCCPRCTRGSPLSDWKRRRRACPACSRTRSRARRTCAGAPRFCRSGGRSGRKRWQKICPALTDGAARLRRAGYDIRQEAGRLCEVYERAVLPFLTDTFLGEEKR